MLLPGGQLVVSCLINFEILTNGWRWGDEKIHQDYATGIEIKKNHSLSHVLFVKCLTISEIIINTTTGAVPSSAKLRFCSNKGDIGN